MKLASTLHAQVAVRAAVRPQTPRLSILYAATTFCLSILSSVALAHLAASSVTMPTIVLCNGVLSGP